MENWREQPAAFSTYQGSASDITETQWFSILLPKLKLLRSHILSYCQMPFCWLLMVAPNIIVYRKKGQTGYLNSVRKCCGYREQTCKYWPKVRISTPMARKSIIACFTSSSVSPRPSMIDDLVIMPSLEIFACFRTAKLWSYLQNWGQKIYLRCQRLWFNAHQPDHKYKG